MITHLAHHGVSLRGVGVYVAEIQLLQFLFVFVSQHAQQGRIGIEQLPFGSGEENSFAQRFEQLSEANLRFMLRGNVADPAADGRNLVFVDERLQPTIVETEARIALQLDRDSSRPVALFAGKHRGRVGPPPS